ncbi:MAG: hypothetical protein P4N59_11455 [Negativicutes bacterium]|nr:hypothetical protein [Negativicutes bacterium]
MKYISLFALLILAACSAAPTVPAPVIQTVYVPWVWPAYLKTCQPDVVPVPAPNKPKLQSQVAGYIDQERNAFNAQTSVADDCRNTLAAAVFANQAQVK